MSASATTTLSQSFLGRTAVVAGATGAIGQAIAATLIERGATVCLIGRTRQSLDELVERMKWPNDRTHIHELDLRDDAAITQFVSDCSRQYPKIHVLAYAAGVIAQHSISAGPIAEFDHQLQVNLRAPFLIARGLVPQLEASRGQIVFINSSAGLHARKETAAYAASKHGLRALADSLRDEVNARGVRVLSVFLGRTASRMQEAVHRQEGRPYDPGILLQAADVAAMIVSAMELSPTAEVTDISIRPMIKSY